MNKRNSVGKTPVRDRGFKKWPTSYQMCPHLSVQDGRCNVNASVCGAKLSKFYNTPSGDTKALVSAIYQNGPISIAIDASHKSFSFYANGVYYEDECGEWLVCAVVLCDSYP